MNVKSRVVTFLVLFAMSFNVAHAYVLKSLDSHTCKVIHFTKMLDHQQSVSTTDICHLDQFFHTLFLLPQTTPFQYSNEEILVVIHQNSLTPFDIYDGILKPPKTTI